MKFVTTFSEKKVDVTLNGKVIFVIEKSALNSSYWKIRLGNNYLTANFSSKWEALDYLEQNNVDME